jgi:hypothetical protein
MGLNRQAILHCTSKLAAKLPGVFHECGFRWLRRGNIAGERQRCQAVAAELGKISMLERI